MACVLQMEEAADAVWLFITMPLVTHIPVLRKDAYLKNGFFDRDGAKRSYQSIPGSDRAHFITAI